MCPLFIGLSYHFYSVYNNIPQLLQYIPGIFSYSSSIAGVFLPCRRLVPGLHDQSAHRASGFSNGLLDLRCTSPPRLASVSGDEPSGLRLWERQSRRALASQDRRSSAWVFALSGGDRAGAPASSTARDRRRLDWVSAPYGQRPCWRTCTAHERLHAVTCTNSNSAGI